MVMQEIYLDKFYLKDKTLGPTICLLELQGPPGSSLLWSITWIKCSSRGVM